MALYGSLHRAVCGSYHYGHDVNDCEAPMSGKLWAGIPRIQEAFWWEDPGIRVVQEKPDGKEGRPKEGIPNYVWAQITNKSGKRVVDALVSFYFSPGSAHLLRKKAVTLGHSYVTLEADEQKDVLCVVPWIPQNVVEVHGCLVVEVKHSVDFFPEDPVWFQPREYSQVATRNVDIVRTMGTTVTIPIRFPYTSTVLTTMLSLNWKCYLSPKWRAVPNVNCSIASPQKAR
jgi:hypothetical protein